MKQTGLIIFILVSFSRCAHKATFKHSKSDTSIVACVYIKDFSGNVYGGMAQVIAKDTLRGMVDSPSGEIVTKSTWTRDTFYNLLQFRPTFGPKKDTIRDSTNKPILKPYFDLSIPKQFVFPTTIVIPK